MTPKFASFGSSILNKFRRLTQTAAIDTIPIEFMSQFYENMEQACICNTNLLWLAAYADL